MAILSVVELNERSGTSGVENVEKGWFWKRAYRRVFLVTTSAKTDDSIVVRNAIDPNTAVGIPTIGSIYQNGAPSGPTLTRDFGSFLQTIDCDEEDRCTESGDTGSYWKVTCSYGPYDPAQMPENPMKRPLQVSWSSSIYQTVAYADVTGKAIVNSAGDYFDPPIDMDDSRPLLTVVRAEPGYDPILTYNYKDAVNSGPFWGMPAGVWKLKDRRSERVYNTDAGTESGYYYEVTYEFEMNPQGWVKKILDQGLRQLVGVNQVNIKDNNGDEITSPVLLNGQGKQLQPLSAPVFRSFNIYNVLDYSVFSLVNPDTGQ